MASIDQTRLMNTPTSLQSPARKRHFYTCIGAGIAVTVASLYMVVQAVRQGALASPACLLLLAIYMVVLGHFCVAVQSYHDSTAAQLPAGGETPVQNNPPELAP